MAPGASTHWIEAKTKTGTCPLEYAEYRGGPLLLPLFLQTVFPKLLLTPRH